MSYEPYVDEAVCDAATEAGNSTADCLELNVGWLTNKGQHSSTTWQIEKMQLETPPKMQLTNSRTALREVSAATATQDIVSKISWGLKFELINNDDAHDAIPG